MTWPSEIPLEADGAAELVDVALEDLRVALRLMLHEVGEPGRERVDLLMQGLVIAALGVLEQGDEEEGEHRRERVDDELPRIDAPKEEDRGHPDRDDDDGDREEEPPADELRGGLGKAVERVPVPLARDSHLRVVLGARSLGGVSGHTTSGYRTRGRDKPSRARKLSARTA